MFLSIGFLKKITLFRVLFCCAEKCTFQDGFFAVVSYYMQLSMCPLWRPLVCVRSCASAVASARVRPLVCVRACASAVASARVRPLWRPLWRPLVCVRSCASARVRPRPRPRIPTGEGGARARGLITPPYTEKIKKGGYVDGAKECSKARTIRARKNVSGNSRKGVDILTCF